MANQTLTQLSQATSASNGDVLYLVTDYETGSPTLTGTSKQIYFSSFTNSLSAVTLNNNINNSILTTTGTLPQLNAETNLTFDGSNLNVTGNTNGSGFGWVNTLQVGSAVTGGTSTGLTTPVYIVARKTDGSSFASGTNTINGWTNEINVGGATWSPSTGQFLSPRNSVYRVTVMLTFTGASASTVSSEISLGINVTSTINSGFIMPQTTSPCGKQIIATATVSIPSGGTLICNLIYSSSGSIPIVSSSANGYNRLIIEELGPIITD